VLVKHWFIMAMVIVRGRRCAKVEAGVIVACYNWVCDQGTSEVGLTRGERLASCLVLTFTKFPRCGKDWMVRFMDRLILRLVVRLMVWLLRVSWNVWIVVCLWNLVNWV